MAPVGAGRILEDNGAAGAVQFSGAGAGAPPPAARKHAPDSWPSGLRGHQGPAVRAMLQSRQKGRPQFSRLGLGHGFAYCDFRHQGAATMLLARSVARPRSLHPPEAARAETPHVENTKIESANIEPVKSEAKPEAGETGNYLRTAPLDRLIRSPSRHHSISTRNGRPSIVKFPGPIWSSARSIRPSRPSA